MDNGIDNEGDCATDKDDDNSDGATYNDIGEGGDGDGVTDNDDGDDNGLPMVPYAHPLHLNWFIHLICAPH